MNIIKKFKLFWTSKTIMSDLITEAVKKRDEKEIRMLIQTRAGKSVIKLIFDNNSTYFHDIMTILTESEDGKLWFKTRQGKKLAQIWDEIDTKAPIPGRPDDLYDIMLRAFSLHVNEEEERVINWIESGGNVNWSIDLCGMTLLHFAARSCNDKLIDYLVNRGANIEARNCDGETPLLLFCHYIANVSINEKEFRALKTLLGLGANVNAQDNKGYTPLQRVRQCRNSICLEAANILETYNAKKIPGKTSICTECGAPESIEVLKRGVQVKLEGNFAIYSCQNCNRSITFSIYEIDKNIGAKVSCPVCNHIASIPSTVWCKTCGNSLSTGWQSKIE